jgi:hypothetical protein
MFNMWVENSLIFIVSYMLVGWIVAHVNKHDIPNHLAAHHEFMRMAPFQLDFYRNDPVFYDREIRAILAKIETIKADLLQFDLLYKSRHALFTHQFKQSLTWPRCLLQEISALRLRKNCIWHMKRDETPYPIKAEVIALEQYAKYVRKHQPTTIHATRVKR